jgi:hypothetical protein
MLTFSSSDDDEEEDEEEEDEDSDPSFPSFRLAIRSDGESASQSEITVLVSKNRMK